MGVDITHGCGWWSRPWAALLAPVPDDKHVATRVQQAHAQALHADQGGQGVDGGAQLHKQRGWCVCEHMMRVVGV